MNQKNPSYFHVVMISLVTSIVVMVSHVVFAH